MIGLCEGVEHFDGLGGDPTIIVGVIGDVFSAFIRWSAVKNGSEEFSFRETWVLCSDPADFLNVTFIGETVLEIGVFREYRVGSRP